ncbi:hypothetical protein DV735_g5299, partial [Chaetothyriales sp. CBS 134920]
MSASKFRVVSHRVPSSYLREFPRATANSPDDELQLSVKQYIPLSNPNPSPGDISIIGAHANAFPKELYEPLWDDLLAESEKPSSRFKIRGIWIADLAHQGESYVLNEGNLGNDPSWYDHPRDLLHIVNLFRKELPRPIFGVGHSVGGNNLTYASLIHPSLFQGLILLDPVIQPQSAELVKNSPIRSPAAASTFRADLWDSKEAALAGFKRSPFYQAWDPRVLDVFVEYGLRSLPTALYPEQNGKVTLTTPVGQEVYTFLRPNYQGHGWESGGKIDRRTHPDIDPESRVSAPFYRSEPPRTFRRLDEVRPSVFYLIGADSYVNSKELDVARVRITGTGIGGSGGAKEGKVKSVTLPGVGHLLALEAPTVIAKLAAEWLGAETENWRATEEELKKNWYSKPLKEKQAIDEDWKKAMGGPPKRRVKKESNI